MAEASGKAIPAPVGGWNARDDWDSMKENEAIFLRNWFPGTDAVETRRGFRKYSTGMTGQVEAIMEYESGNINQMLAAAGDSIYNTTTAAAASLKSGFISAKWQYVNFDGRMGLVNGEDLPQEWDGLTMSDATISGAGLNVRDLVDNEVYNGRVYYVEKDTQDFWYSPIDTLGGALTKFPLSRVGQFGGNLVTIGTWTRDSGDGADDWIVFVMSSGEIIVYVGDPATNFTKVGVFRTAEPLSRRCTLKFGANLWILTRAGLIDFQSIMALGTANYDKAITDKIKGAFTTKTDQFGPRFGWDIMYYPRQSMVLVNIPNGVDLYEQYVINTRTGAWCSFEGMNAFSWSLFDENLFFGGDGVVYQADYGFNDDGEDITADGETSFSYLGSRLVKKQVTMVQVLLKLNGRLTKNVTIGSDFKEAKEPKKCELKSVIGTPWGSPWGSPWSGEKRFSDGYTGVGAWGYNHSLRLRICQQKQKIKWYSNRWVFKRGGVV